MYSRGCGGSSPFFGTSVTESTSYDSFQRKVRGKPQFSSFFGINREENFDTSGNGDEIRKLSREEGLSCAELARRYKVTDAAIAYHLHSDRLTKIGRPPAPRDSVSLSSIESKKAELQRELQRLEAEETRLRELKALKVTFCWDGSGIVIEKETNKLALPISDARTLIDKITELLTPPEVN